LGRMKNSIALIGFMGTGKTAVGKLLAERLGREFIELDGLIEKKAGKPIPEIFRESGEIGFRQLEIEVTREAAAKKNAVIACGGGVVLNRINIDRLRVGCLIVCLAASPSVIWKRTSADAGGRPLLAVDDRMAQIKELLRFRRPFYQRAADITINTSRLNIGGVVEKIIAGIKKYEDIDK
jgi:shikimate kinase